jgi:nucleoside 2-deoxyribosyltransferase
MITCYLAGPIDYEKDKGSSWKKELLDLCEDNKNIGFFDPFAAFKFNKVDQEMAVYVHDVNMIALEKSDILVGRLMRGQASVGTPIEFYQVLNRKPMLIMTDMAESVYMQYIANHATFVDDINKLYGSLLKMAGAMEEQKARMRCGPAEDPMLTKVQAVGAIPAGSLVGIAQ